MKRLYTGEDNIGLKLRLCQAGTLGCTLAQLGLLGGEVLVLFYVIFTGNVELLPALFSFVATSFVFNGASKVITGKGKKIVNKVVDDLEDIVDKRLEVENHRDVEIKVGNIRIGDDLSYSNIIPIFKKGQYILIKDARNPVMLQQIEGESGYQIDVLEEEDPPEIYSNLQMKVLGLHRTIEDKKNNK